MKKRDKILLLESEIAILRSELDYARETIIQQARMRLGMPLTFGRGGIR